MGKTSRNEKRKLTAALLNASGIAALATSILNPAVQSILNHYGWVAYPIAGAVAVALGLDLFIGYDEPPVERMSSDDALNAIVRDWLTGRVVTR